MNHRHVVVGDIGGQIRVFEDVLEALDVDAQFRLPAGVKVTQVGDLVRMYPPFRTANLEIVRLVEKLCRANPHNWTQLIGNHECPPLGGPACPAWDTAASYTAELREILVHLWTSGRLQIADTLELGRGPALITHGGLTRGYWQQIGAPVSARNAANLLNVNRGRPLESFSQPGYTSTRVLTPACDPMWPEIYSELYGPWSAAGDLPFHQIHGHCSSYDWLAGTWRREAPDWVRKTVQLIPEARNSLFPVGRFGRYLLTVDWQLGDVPISGSWPLFQAVNGLASYSPELSSEPLTNLIA